MPQFGDSPVPLLVRHRRSGGTHVADRRVAGVHRATGLAGPTRRYTVIVVMLATMSSLPILAAIGTGSADVGDSVDALGTTPFIAPPSEGPVVVPPPPPTALPAEVPLPAGVAEQLRAGAPEKEPRQRRVARKTTKPPTRHTESVPAPPPASRPPRPTEPTAPPSPAPSPSPSPTPSPRPSLIPLPPRPSFPSFPYVPLPPSATPPVIPPTGLPSCWPDLDACLSDPFGSLRP
ncbi:hypothetical protein [Phytohabitans kaempferiae]|uniref:Uncharacterized protein n=1 Tax=Phytohabitans kaempferiae TaxID=1620943 RepID=A0ABV6M6M8_9ACTN